MPKQLKYISLKGKNKRIQAGLFLDEKEGTHFFIVNTKTLVDFKNRNILTTSNIFSVETFAVLSEVFDKFMNDSEIKNKIIHNELSRTEKFKGVSNF